MNQGQPEQGQPNGAQRPLPQGRRPRPGQGPAQRGAPRPPRQGENGEFAGPPAKQGGGKTWAIAIIITLLLVGGSAFLLMRQSEQQAEVDKNALMVTAFDNVAGGNTTDDSIKTTGILEGLSNEELEALRGGSARDTSTGWKAQLKERMTEEGLIKRELASINTTDNTRAKFLDANFPLLSKIQDASRDAAWPEDNEALDDAILQWLSVQNQVEIYTAALLGLSSGTEASVGNGFVAMISKEFAVLSKKLNQFDSRFHYDAELNSALEALKKGAGDTDKVKRFAFEYRLSKALQMKIRSYEEIKTSKMYDDADRKVALEALIKPDGLGGRNFDGLVELWTNELTSQFKALDENLRKVVAEKLAENKKDRHEYLIKVRDGIIATRTAKVKALEVLRSIGAKYDLNGKPAVQTIYSQLEKNIEIAGKNLTDVNAELGKE